MFLTDAHEHDMISGKRNIYARNKHIFFRKEVL